MTALLSLSGLTVDIPVAAGTLHALRGVTLDVREGEVFAIVGESGCGKSLTAAAILGLLPDSATLRAERMTWDSQDMTRMSRRQRMAMSGPQISAIFQDPLTALNPILSVGEQMTEGFLAHRLGSRSQARARAAELLEAVGVTPAERRMAQFPHELSGGLRQRVMIAMSLMCHPRLVVADEPTTALDVTTQVEILRLLQDRQKEAGLSLVLITHDLGVVAHIADRVAVMYAGEVVEQGSVAQVVGSPAHPYTRALLDCLPDLGQPERKLTPIPGVVPALTGDLTGCAFRNRCPHAHAACAGGIPWHRADTGQGYRCVLAPTSEEAA
ncbi:ABC transporter ATP-binding protein [Pseudooceanicola marinus]|uniref:ABC transporter ATP-binding protein n=1 Tax=Pseudooceanicola marinus TaxID=396013 RepID=UPI001CD55B6C|nr:ABC transporter ATP-binding protein [Pseudooceanicola marinus]MCA1337484.1 ABC transporter ATP-binding protein [Pseudooceanicola marinus]